MPFTIPNEGKVQLLIEQLSAGENWTLGLFKGDITPGETDVAATYTGAAEANFTNYARKTLTRSISGPTWQTVTLGAPAGGWSAKANVAKSTYGAAPQSWTCGATGNTVYGYSVLGAVSGKLIFAERFATPRTFAVGDTLSITPVFEGS